MSTPNQSKLCWRHGTKIRVPCALWVVLSTAMLRTPTCWHAFDKRAEPAYNSTIRMLARDLPAYFSVFGHSVATLGGRKSFSSSLFCKALSFFRASCKSNSCAAKFSDCPCNVELAALLFARCKPCCETSASASAVFQELTRQVAKPWLDLLHLMQMCAPFLHRPSVTVSLQPALRL